MAKGHKLSREDANTVVQKAVDTAINTGGEIGLQVAAYLNGELVISVWGGLADETTGRKVDENTLFQTFSVAKAVTSTALHIQAERGLVDYDKPVAYYWPEFAAHGKDKLTVRDAITHRQGIPLMPEGVTPELMCDFEWMVQQLADMKPAVQPGVTSYGSYTFGWPVAEVVRRTDPKRRPFGTFVQEELCAPLHIDSLWLGIPDEAEPRVAKLTNAPPPNDRAPAASAASGRIPAQVGTCEEVSGRPDVRRACIPGASCLTNARSEARFFALLANGGELDGVRLLSEDRVRSISLPRRDRDEIDPLSLSPSRHVGHGGLYVGDDNPSKEDLCWLWNPVIGSNARTMWHLGAGSSIGWADPDARLAVAICHNRMFYPDSPQTPFVPIADAIRDVLGLAG